VAAGALEEALGELAFQVRDVPPLHLGVLRSGYAFEIRLERVNGLASVPLELVGARDDDEELVLRAVAPVGILEIVYGRRVVGLVERALPRHVRAVGRVRVGLGRLAGARRVLRHGVARAGLRKGRHGSGDAEEREGRDRAKRRAHGASLL
jgi:hypothetical protein